MLRHPCILEGPQCQARGAKSEVVPNKGEQNQKWLPHPCLLGGPKEGRNAGPPLHSRGSPTASAGSQNSEGVPNKGEQYQKWLPHTCLLRGPKEGRNATSPLHSRGSPMPSAGSKIRSGPQQRGAKSEVAASPLPSWGPKRGQKCYITPAFSGIPNAKRGEQNQKWSPTKGNTIGSGCLTPSFLGAEKRAEMLHFPFNMRGPPHQARGAKIQKWSPTKGNKIRSGCLTLAFSGAQKRAEMLRHPCNLRDPQCQARGAKSEVVPNIGEQYQKWLPHPYLLVGPKEGTNATSPLHSRGSPTPSAGSKIRSGCLSPTFLGAQKRAEMLGHPCILGDPQRQARGAKIQKWSPTKRNNIRSGCLTLAFSGAQKRAEMLRHPCILGDPQRQARGAKIQKWSPTKGSKIRSQSVNFNTKNNCETQLRPSLSTREATATWLEHRRLSSPSHGVGGNDRQCMIIQMAASSTNGIVIRRGRRRIDSLNATNLTMNLLFTRFSQKKGPVGAQIGVGNSGKHSCRIKARAIKLSHPQTPATARKKTFWTAQKKKFCGANTRHIRMGIGMRPVGLSPATKYQQTAQLTSISGSYCHEKNTATQRLEMS